MTVVMEAGVDVVAGFFFFLLFWVAASQALEYSGAAHVVPGS